MGVERQRGYADHPRHSTRPRRLRHPLRRRHRLPLDRESPARARSSWVLIAQNAGLVFSILSGSPPGVIVEQKFELWDDQDTGNQRRCQFFAGRLAGQLLTYTLTPTSELLIGSPSLMPRSTVPYLPPACGSQPSFSRASSRYPLRRHYRLFVYSATPDPEVLPVLRPRHIRWRSTMRCSMSASLPQFLCTQRPIELQLAGWRGADPLRLLADRVVSADPYTGGFQYGRDQGVSFMAICWLSLHGLSPTRWRCA